MKHLSRMIVVMIAIMVYGCGLTNDIDFKETDDGLQYAFHVQTGKEKPELGDILSMEMIYHVNDSVMFNSHEQGMPMYLKLMEPMYPGDIYDGLAMMSLGDSASFRLDAEKFFMLTAAMPEIPAFIQPGDPITFHISLLKIMDDDAFAEEQQRIMQQQMEEDMLRAEQEEGLMLDYLEEEGITVEPTPSGLYYIEKEKGDGTAAESGKMVKVHYEGRLLDGTVFDSSYERGEPIEFIVGHGQVIPGWDEGIGMMNVGGKARLVIPSYLGYGERGAGAMIPAFSTLVFDVELVDVSSAN